MRPKRVAVERKKLVEMYKELLSMVQHGDFRNGVTAQGVDEGQSYADRTIKKHLEFLEDIERRIKDES